MSDREGGRPTPVLASEQPLPHNIEAERAVLGACLVNADAYDRAGPLDAADFFRDGHRTIWRAYDRLRAKGAVLDDPVLLRAELGEDLERVGGPAYVAGLMDGCPRSTNVEHYAAIVRETARRRRRIEAARQIAEHAYQGDGPVPADALDVFQDPAAGKPLFRRGDQLPPPPETPWLWLGFLIRGMLTLLAGVRSSGKSMLAAYIAAAVSSGRPFPGETDFREPEIVVWIGHFDEDDDYVTQLRLMAHGADMSRVYILDTALDGVTFDEVVAAAAALKPAFAVVDSKPAFDTGDSNAERDTRDWTARLRPLRKAGAAVLPIVHFRKSAEDEGAAKGDRIAGSIQLPAAAPIVLLAEGVDGEGWLTTDRNKRGPKGGDLGYRTEGCTVETDAGPRQSARLTFTDLRPPGTAPTPPRGGVPKTEDGEPVTEQTILGYLVEAGEPKTVNAVCSHVFGTYTDKAGRNKPNGGQQGRTYVERLLAGPAFTCTREGKRRLYSPAMSAMSAVSANVRRRTDSGACPPSAYPVGADGRTGPPSADHDQRMSAEQSGGQTEPRDHDRARLLDTPDARAQADGLTAIYRTALTARLDPDRVTTFVDTLGEDGWNQLLTEARGWHSMAES